MASRTRTTENGDEIAAAFQAAPGTEILYDEEGEHGATSHWLHTLQHVPKGDSHILLVPQPSLTDPNDPLKWSTFKKWVVLLNAVFYSFMGAVTGPIMAAGKENHLPPAPGLLTSMGQEWSASPSSSANHCKKLHTPTVRSSLPRATPKVDP